MWEGAPDPQGCPLCLGSTLVGLVRAPGVRSHGLLGRRWPDGDTEG